ncbi:MFS transporter [Ruminococcus sp. CLA-AA-H200]|uniref:MFS transporter n=1 Tax=Ruminococcus turbiniformis TaxID=2881258 RepID=A0ABS8G5C1_9FIRM|nr:MFS transporter [Ruminococcus turbiniformis]MCC2256139.1 MFS transporter [Ruminococcus turbiniformis]
MNKTSKAYGYTMLIILMLGTAVLYYSNLIFTVRLDTLEVFNMSTVQLAAISTIGGIPGAVLSIIVGNILDRKSIKWFVSVSLVLTVACMIIRVFLTSYTGLLVTTVLIGAFLLPIIIVGPKMLGNLFEPEDIPFAAGCFGAAGGIGTTLAFATGPVYPSVQAALGGVAVVGAIVLVAWTIMCKPDNQTKRGPAPEIPKGAFVKVLKSSNMWKTMICGGCAVGTSLIINTSLTQGFAERGYDASGLGTILNVCLIIGGIVSGMVLGKIGTFNIPYLFMCVVGGGLYLAGWLVEPAGSILSILLFALAGLIASATVGVNFTRIPLLHLTKQFGEEMTGAASGMLQTALGIFQFVVPTAVAAVAVMPDGSTNYTLKFILGFVFLVIAGVIGLSIPELGIKGKLAQEAAGKSQK